MSNHIEPNKLAAPKQDSKQASEKFEQLFASRIKKLKDRRATAYEFLWAIALVTAAVERQNKRSDRSLRQLAEEVFRELVVASGSEELAKAYAEGGIAPSLRGNVVIAQSTSEPPAPVETGSGATHDPEDPMP